MGGRARIATNNIDRFIQRAESLNGNVALTELMPDDFIQQHTNFNSLQELVDAAKAEGIVHDEALAEDMQSEAFSTFVAQNSTVESWAALMQEATPAYIKRKMGL